VVRSVNILDDNLVILMHHCGCIGFEKCNFSSSLGSWRDYSSHSVCFDSDSPVPYFDEFYQMDDDGVACVSRLGDGFDGPSSDLLLPVLSSSLISKVLMISFVKNARGQWVIIYSESPRLYLQDGLRLKVYPLEGTVMNAIVSTGTPLVVEFLDHPMTNTTDPDLISLHCFESLVKELRLPSKELSQSFLQGLTDLLPNVTHITSNGFYKETIGSHRLRHFRHLRRWSVGTYSLCLESEIAALIRSEGLIANVVVNEKCTDDRIVNALVDNHSALVYRQAFMVPFLLARPPNTSVIYSLLRECAHLFCPKG